MTPQNGYQAESAPRNPTPPSNAGSAVQRSESIEHVISVVVEAPRHKPTDAEWKEATFTGTPEVM